MSQVLRERMMINLNENEEKMLRAICEGCDEIDGWGFHRPSMVVQDLIKLFDYKAKVAGGYLRDLIDKDLIEFDRYDDTIWVRPEVYSEFC